MLNEWVNKVVNGDCNKLLSQLPPDSIDLIITDAPLYANPSWLNKAYNALKKGKLCFIITSPPSMFKLKGLIASSGFNLIQVIIRSYLGIVPVSFTTPSGLYNRFQPIFMLSKGVPSINVGERADKVGVPRTDVWNCPDEPVKVKIPRTGTPFGAQKPLELIKYMVLLGSNEGELVLDPFLGSGTTAIACNMLGRRWIGFEVSKDYCEVARERIKEKTK